ncbi:MAG: orotidine-5'-phosphate decarboxylase [Treponema sp.]|nr:orotidine-5'-phosphate decarboxylase [Treponema sp.]
MNSIKLNMDKLYEAVAAKGHVCIGLDTAADYVPQKERQCASSDAEAVLAFNLAVIEATLDTAACYKVQIAYYEELGIAGLETYSKTLKYIRQKGALVIADIKRGDIADTASRYARAHFEGNFEADFVTLSPYLGMDAVEPWLKWAYQKGKGAFVLMRTSNPGMKDFQYLKTGPNRRMYNEVGDKLTELTESGRGIYRYGPFGAVVGADPKTDEEKQEAIAIRNQYPGLFFLIPGYGAQGGAAKDAVLLLREGNGGVVNASRSIIKAWSSDTSETAGAGKLAEADNVFAATKARDAAIKMRDAIKNELKRNA